MTAPLHDVVIPDAKADKTYKDTVNGLRRSLADFTARQGLSAGQYNSNYTQNLNDLGYNFKGGAKHTGAFDYNKPGDFHDSMYTNQNDFAGRGAYYSGQRAQADQQIGNDFDKRKAAMDLARRQAAETRTADLTSFTTQQDITRNAALTDALSRIASQYGIAIGQVPVGHTSTVQRQTF